MDCEEISIETGEWDGQGWTVRRLATAVRVHIRTCTADLTSLLAFLRFVWNQNVGWGGAK